MSPPSSEELPDTMMTTSLVPPPDPLLTCLLVAGDGVCVDGFLGFLLTDGVVLYAFSCLIEEIKYN